MWNKWDKDILRTTNIAESYHNTIARVMKNRRPPLWDLLAYLHGLNSRFLGILLHHEKVNKASRSWKTDHQASCRRIPAKTKGSASARKGIWSADEAALWSHVEGRESTMYSRHLLDVISQPYVLSYVEVLD